MKSLEQIKADERDNERYEKEMGCYRLVAIKMVLTNDGKWEVTRERAKEHGGEKASGLNSLEECFDYIRAHNLPTEINKQLTLNHSKDI